MSSMSRPGEGRYAHRGPTGNPYTAYPTYDVPPVRPGEAAAGYFAGQVPAPHGHRVTPRGIAWACALFVFACAWLRLVLGYPGFGSSAAANDRMTAGWLPLFLLACAAAPLVATALAADRQPSDPYAENTDHGHPVWVPLLTGIVTALAAVAAVAVAAAAGPHTVAAVAVGCGVVAAVGIGTAAGLLTVYRPVLRVPVTWAALAIGVGLTLHRAFVWAVEPHAIAYVPAVQDTDVPYAPVLLAVGVAGTALVGGLAGFVRASGQAPLLAAVAGLWLCATALSVVGPGLPAIAAAPWRTIAATLAGAVAGVLGLAVRTWWQEYR